MQKESPQRIGRAYVYEWNPKCSVKVGGKREGEKEGGRKREGERGRERREGEREGLKGKGKRNEKRKRGSLGRKSEDHNKVGGTNVTLTAGCLGYLRHHLTLIAAVEAVDGSKFTGGTTHERLLI